MNSYKNRIAQYQGGAPMFNNATGVAPVASNVAYASTLDPNDRTLTFNIINSDTATAAVVTLFGSARDLTDALLPAGLTVNVLESSHQQVKTELLTNPFRIYGLKMTATNVNQFSNTWSIFRSNSTGFQQRKMFQPINYRSAQNNLTTQVDATGFELVVDLDTYVQFTVNASENVTIIFNLSERTNTTNLLTGNAIREVATSTAPTGLPQIDLYANQAMNVTR